MLLRRRIQPEEREREAKRIKLEKSAKLTEEMKEIRRKAQRPFVKYLGKIHYYTEMIDMAMACDSLLNLVNESEDTIPIGFDLEWPFSYQTGPGRVALIQISPNLETCYLLHVSQIKNLPKGLNELLANKKVRIVGNNIKNDIRKLARDFKLSEVETIIDNCIDLGVMANTILPTTHRWSLEKLVDYLLDLRINKDKKVRNSKWHVIPLSEAQMKYAAIDAYVSLQLHQILVKKKSEKETETHEEVKENLKNN